MKTVVVVVDGCGSEHLNQPTIEVYKISDREIKALLGKYGDMLSVAMEIMRKFAPIKKIEADYIVSI